MSLAFELTKIPGSDYLPRPEFMDNRAAFFNDNYGIWDLLGIYDGSVGTIVLYEENLNSLAAELSSGRSNVYPVLRELVRVHEHAHAYMHTANLFEGIYARPLTKAEWFKQLSNEVS